MPTKGFIDAYDAKTGKRVWRFNTTPTGGARGRYVACSEFSEAGARHGLREVTIRI